MASAAARTPPPPRKSRPTTREVATVAYRFFSCAPASTQSAFPPFPRSSPAKLAVCSVTAALVLFFERSTWLLCSLPAPARLPTLSRSLEVLVSSGSGAGGGGIHRLDQTRCCQLLWSQRCGLLACQLGVLFIGARLRGSGRLGSPCEAFCDAPSVHGCSVCRGALPRANPRGSTVPPFRQPARTQCT